MKKIAEEVLERSNGLCEVCGADYMCQLHHIIGGRGKRTQHQNKFSVINLCWYCHHSNNGVHGMNGRKLDLKLKKQLQDTYFSQGHAEGEVRKMMGGKIY